jgi:2-dehydropantoate 2-reductase
LTRIAILGGGAIGSVFGAYLSRAGEDVTLIGRPQQVRAILENGLIVEAASGSFTCRLAAAEKLQFNPDVAFLTVKSQDVLRVLEENRGSLHQALVITCQNGVRSDDMASTILARQQILSAVVNISATYLDPGRVTVVYPGTLVIGRPFAKLDDPARELGTLLSSVAPTTVSANIRGAHWLKLLFNLNNAFPALLNMSLHHVYRVPYMRALAVRVIREGLRTVGRAGIRLESLPEVSVGLFRLLAILPLPVASLLVAMRARRIASRWPLLGSTLQSIRRGRPSEIDFLNGEIVRLGHDVREPTPLNAALVGMVHHVERSAAFLTIDQLRGRIKGDS